MRCAPFFVCDIYLVNLNLNDSFVKEFLDVDSWNVGGNVDVTYIY